MLTSSSNHLADKDAAFDPHKAFGKTMSAAKHHA